MPANSTHNIAIGLATLRAKRGCSLRELHATLQPLLPRLTLSRLNRYALGYSHPTWHEIQDLANALHTSPETLAGITSPTAPPSPVPAPPRPAAIPAATNPPAAFPDAPSAIPDRGAAPLDSYRQTLAAALHHARSILHTPKLPPQCWARWRAYEKALLNAAHSLPPA